MTPTAERVFSWHPDYRGRNFDDVREELAQEIARDQRSYEVALMGAEESEHDALASVVDIERRWSPYDFGWNDADPRALAERISEFQWAREQRNEMISWQEYRNTSTASVSGTGRTGSDWRASMSDEQRRKVANGLAASIIGLILVVIVVVLVIVL